MPSTPSKPLLRLILFGTVTLSIVFFLFHIFTFPSTTSTASTSSSAHSSSHSEQQHQHHDAHPQPHQKLKKSSRVPCIITGCSSELCSNESDEEGFSICMYKEEFECYDEVGAVCEMQQLEGSEKKCGWTMTTALRGCLERVRARRGGGSGGSGPV
ncbi:hypothetical protein HK102_006050 [Quaeritorhiza haematococci]|nr:hypothetical protein HK102_006050 [Quaeritorhiza haematococci]